MVRIGTLLDATDVQRRRRLNSDYELSFLVPMTSDDYREKIQIKGHVQDERGQFYVINTRQRVRDGKKLTAQITATHIMFKMNDFKIPYNDYIEEMYGVPIVSMLDRISAATGGKYTFVVHDTFDLRDVKDFGRTTALAALNQIVGLYGCEIEPDNFTIHVHKQLGADRGFQYRIQKNIVSSHFKDEGANLVTRMYAQMKDGRTWIGQDATNLMNEELSLLQAIPGAIQNGKIMVNYLISPFAQYWANSTNTFYDGELIDQNIEDPIELLKATREALRKSEVPELDISVNAADIHKIDSSEQVPGMGDTVHLIDPDMDMINITARITDMTEYPFAQDKHTQVTLANYVLRDYVDIIADLERSKTILDGLLSGGRIRTEAFETFAKQAITDINNSKTELIYPPEGGILAQEKGNKLNQVRLTAAGLGISTDGWKTVRSAVTARGVVAETIVGQFGNFVSLLIGYGNNVTQINQNGIAAGHANFNSAPFQVAMNGDVIARSIKLTGQIDNSTMLSSLIQASRIVGNEIEGGTITGALIRTAASGRRIEHDASGFRTYDSSGRNRININTGNDNGVSAISFFGTGGGFAGEINSYQSLNQLNIISDSLFLGSNNTANPISMNGATRFNGLVTFNSGISGITIDNISGLSSRLNDLQTQITTLSQLFYNHTHNVNIGTHNHGNPQNQNWPANGGNFTTSTP
ncbi:phage tail spike protein [Paenibacillus sp. OAE614]|uniref:phage tail protein n=1 Tax=Paenibacillus sp. OAE614 TaxID=2663804 RepID=UPI001789A303